MIPSAILSAYGLPAETTQQELTGGMVHKTFLVKPSPDPERWVIIQGIRSLFQPGVMGDISAITEHLAKRGVQTPRAVKTAAGALFVNGEGGSWWRALTYIPGRAVHRITDAEMAKQAGAFVGRFHSALADLNHSFAFSLPHFHDTKYHIERARTVVEGAPAERRTLFQEPMAFIEQEYLRVQARVAGLPQRIIHGDLKISNVIFAERGPGVNALIDLDTLMHQSVVTELGDAFRSWCATGEEGESSLAFDVNMYEAALAGYLHEAPFITDAERASIPFGVAVITLELSARFIADACEESYFTFDRSRYPSLFEQNKMRAESQLSLYRSMRTRLPDLL